MSAIKNFIISCSQCDCCAHDRHVQIYNFIDEKLRSLRDTRPHSATTGVWLYVHILLCSNPILPTNTSAQIKPDVSLKKKLVQTIFLDSPFAHFVYFKIASNRQTLPIFVLIKQKLN